MSEAMKKPRCKLTYTDGNVFALAGRVAQALPAQRLRRCQSYDEALRLFMEYVNVY